MWRRKRWTPKARQSEPRVKVPAGFEVGSNRGERDGGFDESPVHFINIKSLVGGGACGYVGEGEYFPAFRAGSGGGESGAGRQRRSSTYPQAFIVNLPRRAVAEALVPALLIVEIESATFRNEVGHRFRFDLGRRGEPALATHGDTYRPSAGSDAVCQRRYTARLASQGRTRLDTCSSRAAPLASH
jgi:hypothetical protein